MPNGFGNIFAIPQIDTRGIAASVPKYNPMSGLAALIQAQNAVLRQARAAGGAGGALGPGQYKGVGDPSKGRWVKLPGVEKPVWIVGTTEAERNANEAKAINEARNAIVQSDPELAKQLREFGGLSIPGKKAALDKLRTSGAIAGLAPKLEMSEGDTAKFLLDPLETTLQQQVKAVKAADTSAQFSDMLSEIGDKFIAAVRGLGASAEARGAISRDLALQREERIKNNARAEEFRRLEQEGRSNAEYWLTHPVDTALMHAAPIVATAVPQLVAGGIGTAVGGPIAGLAAASVVGGLTSGAYGAGEMLERAATDPTLTTPEQRTEAADKAYTSGGLASAVVGAIPVGPGAIPGAIGKRLAARSFSMLPWQYADKAAEKKARDAVLAEVYARGQAQRGRFSRYGGSMLSSATDAATLGAAEQFGHNVGYNWATGQNNPWSEGLAEQGLAGAVLGSLFGIRGGRLGRWTRQIPTPEQRGVVREPWDAMRAAEYRRGAGVPDTNLPAVYESPVQDLDAARYVNIPEPIQSLSPVAAPVMELPWATPRSQRPVLERGTGAMPMGEEPIELRRERLRSKIEREIKAFREKQAKERARVEKLEGEKKEQAQAELKLRQAEEREIQRAAWQAEWDSVYNPNPPQAQSGDRSVLSERSPAMRGITPLFEERATNTADPMNVLSGGRRPTPAGAVADMTMLEHEDFVRSKPKFQDFYDRVDTADESRPQDITDLLVRGIERGAITRAEVETIAQNAANNAIKSVAVQRALTIAKEPVKKLSAEDKFFTSNPGYNDIYAYLSRDGVTSKEAASVTERAILEGKLSPDLARQMAYDMASTTKGGERNKVVKGIALGTKNAEMKLAEQAMREVESAPEPAYTTSIGREQAPFVAATEQLREGKPDSANPFIDSAEPVNTEAAAPAAADPALAEARVRNSDAEGRGDAGAATPDTGTPEAVAAAPRGQESRGTPAVDGERGGSAAAPKRATADIGERSIESEAGAGPSRRGDGTDAGGAAPVAHGNATEIINNDNTADAAHYEVWELDDLIPSHDPDNSFAKRPDYPKDVQERPYHSDRGEQDKVRINALQHNTDLVLTDNPAAENGPPIIAQDGVVLGGNSRVMTLQLVYGDVERGANYRDALLQRAAHFGINPDDVASMRRPVLVRAVEGRMTPAEVAVKSRKYNQGMTQKLQSKAEGVSRARLLSTETLNELSTDLAEFNTLREYFADPKSRRFVQSLQRDGVIDRTEASALIDKDGRLNARGKDLAEDALRGLVMPDYDILAHVPPSILNKLDKAIPALAKLKARGEGWNITNVLMPALRHINAAQRNGQKLATWYDQVDMLNTDSDKGRPAVQVLARTLDGATQKEVLARFDAFAKAAERRQKGRGSLIDTPEAAKPDGAFIEAFMQPIASVGGKPVANFNPAKNARHAALAWVAKHGGESKTVAGAQARLENIIQSSKASAAEKAEAKERLSALSGYSGAITVYEPKLENFPYRKGAPLELTEPAREISQQAVENTVEMSDARGLPTTAEQVLETTPNQSKKRIIDDPNGNLCG